MMAATVSTDPEFRVESRRPLFAMQLDLNALNTNYDVHPDGERFIGLPLGEGFGEPQLVVFTNWLERLRQVQGARR